MRCLQRLLSLVLILLSFACCTPPAISPRISLKVAGPATSEQRAALLSGAARANAKSSPTQQARVLGDREGNQPTDLAELWAVQFVPLISFNTDGGTTAIGLRCAKAQQPSCPQGRTIYVVSSLAPALTLRVVQHEILHALGLEHVSYSAHSVMSPIVHEDAEWSAEDAAECSRVGVCPP